MGATSVSSGLTQRAFEGLRRELVDLVEPLSDEQLLDLADGIHEMLRQRRAVRIGRPAPAATLDGGGAGAAGPCGGRRPPCPAPSSGPSVMMVFPSARGSSIVSRRSVSP